MPIDSKLSSASGYPTHFFFKNVGMVPEKAARLENPLWSVAAKLESVGTKFFSKEVDPH